ncbi:FliA/WhiG family RNA polymerase sigma factor [Anaeromicropila populeti]|uniref:RNA polymerase sigma factor for flagellar operon FliA n=1 Tax=Anaeromicropila populeti TaxID=37658 RepID=A0A1I6KXN1_9FIRM|nr:FliA/WhiG family RNA polymerase sigma factor [Anaeromicropila populeti]SFR95972.1 RNA polymerase sigma factor for flagellar operon FliA [Anaeromicropila populeti]
MNEDERSRLWNEYAKSRKAEIRERLIIEYAGLVKVVAGRLNMYLGYAVEQDDLIGYGSFGLIDAIDKFDCTKGVKFETYASLRIRGSIIDHIRKMDWIPRTLRQRQKKMDQAYQKIEFETGRSATDEEVAKELEISVSELEQWRGQMKITNLVSLDEFFEQGSELKEQSNLSSHFQQPEIVMEKQELKRELEEVLETLTENEKKVIALYYYEELTLKEISHILEVSESRVSQLHTKALQKMKKKLGNIDIY